MAAAVRQQPVAPPRAAAAGGFLGFLKDGVAIATRNRGLFLPLVALQAARRTAFFHARTLAYRSFATAVDLEAYGDEVGGTLLLSLLGKFLAGRRWRILLLAGAVYLVAHVTLGLAIDAATATAAVAAAAAACSSAGEDPNTTTSSSSLASLLGKAKGNLVGPVATAVFAGTLGWGLVGVVWLPVPAVAYLDPGVVLLVLLLEFVALLFTFFYFDAMCAVAVVVSAAEPGVRAAAAVGRARRLMRGGRKLAQAAVYSLVAWTLDKAVWKVHAVAMAWLPQSGLGVVPFGLDAVVVYLLLGVLKVLCTATVTAYYFDCRRTEEDEEKAGHAD